LPGYQAMSHLFTYMDSPVGRLRLEAADGALAAVYFPEHRGAPALRGIERPTEPVLRAAALQLREYFAGRRRRFELPVRSGGTAFQRAVWDALLTIPFGCTWSYSELARAVGRPLAVRAVGAANGRNPLSIV